MDGEYRRVRFSIPGEPAPKGSRILGVRQDGTPFSRPASNRERPWTAGAAESIQTSAGEVRYGTQPVAVFATFHCRRPQRPKYDHPVRGDVDKFARCLLDAIVAAGVCDDDRHVVELRVSKTYSDEPRVDGWISPAP
jgi:Holliday junction resolvase RusA-like endonuclease